MEYLKTVDTCYEGMTYDYTLKSYNKKKQGTYTRGV